jgi:RNA polymerase I-specific transcription initiation factor RRN6
MRLDVRSQVKCASSISVSPSSLLTLPARTDDGTIIAMYYKGAVALTPGVQAVLSGSKDAKTTEFGDSFVTFGFETGSEKYKGLQDGVYVAAGRFVKEGEATVVEYRVGRVGI